MYVNVYVFCMHTCMYACMYAGREIERGGEREKERERGRERERERENSYVCINLCLSEMAMSQSVIIRLYVLKNELFILSWTRLIVSAGRIGRLRRLVVVETSLYIALCPDTVG